MTASSKVQSINKSKLLDPTKKKLQYRESYSSKASRHSWALEYILSYILIDFAI